MIFPLIEARKTYAATPMCVYPPGVYDSTSGYCIANPLDEKHSCPQFYTFNYETNKCVLMPVCSGLYVYNKTTKQCEAVQTTGGGDSGDTWTMPANSCAVDFNGDGDIQQNEIFACTQTPQGYICPQGQTECNPQFIQPGCPAGYTYNGQTQKCEAPTNIGTCSSTQVPYTNYQCPVSGQIYMDAATCNNNCKQVATCSQQGTASASGCGWEDFLDLGQYYQSKKNWSRFIDFWGSGNTFCTRTRNGQACINPSSASGCGWEDFLDLGQYYQSKKNWSRFIDFWGSGNTFCTRTRNGQACITMGYTYTCPLSGGSACSGNPPTCTKGQTCVTHSDSATKYQCSLNGQNYDTQSQCTTSCYSGCPAGGSFNPQTGKCEATATCPSGTLQSSGCFTGYGCPLGNYQCMNVNDRWMCSSNQCFTESQIENDEPDMIASTYDAASTGQDGTCTGEWSIFSGSKMRCQKSGIKTGFHNCCDESNGKIYDNMGSTGISSITDAVGAIYAATKAVQLGSYASKIASGTYVFSRGALNDASNGMKPVANFAPNTPEYAALEAASNNASQGADVAVGSAMGTYVQQMGPQIASAIAQLAVSQVISDPVLAASVNLAFSASLWVAGVGGPVGFALAATNLAATLFMSSCDKQDIITSTMDDSGRCHYMGTYCTKKIKFVGCVQKVKSFCCFNSKLARIVQEQGRPQLATFGADGGWGSAKHPNCRGFTPEEFQALNFDNIDLSEYTEDIERSVRKNIESTLQNTATQSLQNRGVK